jgi:hypothetical protein
MDISIFNKFQEDVLHTLLRLKSIIDGVLKIMRRNTNHERWFLLTGAAYAAICLYPGLGFVYRAKPSYYGGSG